MCHAAVPSTKDEYVARLQKRADAGDARAQVLIGTNKTEDDPKEAVRLLKLAAEQGLASAEAHLGRCYLEGRGIDQDASEAVRLWESAAAKGDGDPSSVPFPQNSPSLSFSRSDDE